MALGYSTPYPQPFAQHLSQREDQNMFTEWRLEVGLDVKKEVRMQGKWNCYKWVICYYGDC